MKNDTDDDGEGGMKEQVKLHRPFHPTAEYYLFTYAAAAFPNLPPARRRQNARLGVPRSAEFVPVSATREAYYEQKLLEGLPWHLRESLRVVEQREVWSFESWPFDSREDLALHLELRGGEPWFALDDKAKLVSSTCEAICYELEHLFAEESGFQCPC